MKLKFDSGKNTQLVTFRVDPITINNLTALRNLYSKEARRRVTTGEILKKLINLHHKEILGEIMGCMDKGNFREKLSKILLTYRDRYGMMN